MNDESHPLVVSSMTRPELIVELVKVLVWPCFAAIVFLALWNPLRRTAELIPSLVGNSETITIAGLSLKVGHTLRAKATPEMAAVLAAISNASLDRLIDMGTSTYWDKSSEADGRDANRELMSLGLVEEIPRSSLNETNRIEGKNYTFAVRLTDLGSETQDFFQSAAKQFAQELARETKANQP